MADIRIRKTSWDGAVSLSEADVDRLIREFDAALPKDKLTWIISGDTLVAAYKYESGAIDGYICRVAQRFEATP